MPKSFKHFVDDEKINRLIQIYGADGYFVYFRTVEFFIIRKNSPVVLDIKTHTEDLICFLDGLTIEKLHNIYDYIQENIGLFEPDVYNRGILQIRGLKSTHEPRPIAVAIEGKVNVADYVYLNEKQINEFTEKYGSAFYKRCVEVLSAYKANAGGTSRYVDDAAAMRSWVVERVKKENVAKPTYQDQPRKSPEQIRRKSASNFDNY